MGVVADERLGAELAEEGVHHTCQIHPQEGGQAAEAAVGAAMDAADSSRWGRQETLAASVSELGPVASEDLVRGSFLRRNREQVCPCSLLHQFVFDWEAVATTPDYGRVLIGFLVSVPILPLLLHGTAWPTCGQQVPEAGVREMVILVIEMDEL